MDEPGNGNKNVRKANMNLRLGTCMHVWQTTRAMGLSSARGQGFLAPWKKINRTSGFRLQSRTRNSTDSVLFANFSFSICFFYLHRVLEIINKYIYIYILYQWSNNIIRNISDTSALRSFYTIKSRVICLNYYQCFAGRIDNFFWTKTRTFSVLYYKRYK